MEDPADGPADVPGAGVSSRSAGEPELARDVLAGLRARGWTLGVAESLTGGGVASSLVAVPGASAVLRGGIVAYATDLKARLLGVDEGLLARQGPVDPEVASRMAAGVREVCGADVGIATTGVAGPDPQYGHAPGLVFVAVSAPGAEQVRQLGLSGSRADVVAGATSEALRLTLGVISDLS